MKWVYRVLLSCHILLVLAQGKKSKTKKPYELIEGANLDKHFYNEFGSYVGEYSLFDEEDDNEIDYHKRYITANSQARTILKDYYKLDSSDVRRHNGITHAYVTPWNNHGYDVVKWAAKKFTHVTPVWFQIRFALTESICECQIHGTHDIDRQWLDDILKNNSAIKFWPRFLFELNMRDESDHECLQQFLSSETVQHQCTTEIIGFSTRHGFHGVLLEIWVQLVVFLQEQDAEMLIEFIEEFTKAAHADSLEVVLPLPPPFNYKREQSNALETHYITRLARAVDYLQIMTYDYQEPRTPTPVSPLDWVVDNMAFLSSEAAVPPSKLLMGMNWYGYRYDSSLGHIFGKDFVNYLEDPTAKMEYDLKFKEFRVLFKHDTALAFYPTTGTLFDRIAKCEELGLAGFSIWDVGQGLDYFTYVL